MTEVISAREYEARMEGYAKEAFADHKVKVIGRGHWYLSQEGKQRGLYWTHVVAMGPGLAVWGDIDACVFAFHSGTPVELVKWVSGMIASSYAREKVSIGMSAPETAQDYEDGVAIHELNERLKNLPEEHGEEWEHVGSIVTDAIQNALHMIDQGFEPPEWQGQLLSDLHHVEPDAWEWVGSLGKVTSSRVIYALAAVKRLDVLLKDLVFDYEEAP